MSYLPCKNPSCKSYGKPHPNCHCYGEMSEGGEVTQYCSEHRKHDPSCEYYAEGGHVDEAYEVAGHCAHMGIAGLLRSKSDFHKGHKHIANYCSALVNDEKMPVKDVSQHKEIIRKWLAKGGIVNDIQQEIHKHHASEEPNVEHNLSSQVTKGRVSNYLNSLKPSEHTPKLAFDPDPDHTADHKSYEKALHIAAHPLSVLEEAKKGTITPEHVHHLMSMFPELKSAIDQKLTEHITHDQLAGTKPSAKIRQGMSDILGVPLSSNMNAQNIIAAQATFKNLGKNQESESGQVSPAKQGTAKSKKTALSKSDQAFLTGSQALVGRSQRQS